MRRIMQDEVLDMDELAIDPQRGAGIGEMHALDPSLTDRGAGNSLVEARQGRSRIGKRLKQALDGQFRKIVTH